MLKASDLFTIVCEMLEKNGYGSWRKVWAGFSNLVMLEYSPQKTDVTPLKHEIAEAHKWVEANARIPRRTKQELLTLLGYGGRVLRLSNISKVNQQPTEDVAAVIARYYTSIGPAKLAVASHAAVSSPRSTTRPVGAPPKSKKSTFVRAAAPNRAAKSTRKGSSGKTVASGKLRS